MESLDLPFQTEYAKSGRASCKKCKGSIPKDSLRLAAMVQSPHFDGKVPQWYHYMCFFAKQRPKSVEDIANFDSLRWDDQQKIKKKIEEAGSGPTPSGKSKGKSKTKSNSDFCLEYSKSGRAKCKGCLESILKDVVRISKKDYESDSARRFGSVDRWHHVDCFVKLRNELEFFESGDSIPGFNTLSADDKKMIKQKLKKIEGKRKAEEDNTDGSSTKKQKVEDNAEEKEQNKKIYFYRDWLSKNLAKGQIQDLLEHNDAFVSKITENLDHLADIMTFGSIKPCSVCKHGLFIYKYGIGYTCKGDLTEWTKCTNSADAPSRKPFVIPKEYKDDYPFLAKYKYKDLGPRIIHKREAPLDKPSSSNGNIPLITPPELPLKDMKFLIDGKGFTKKKTEMKKKIKDLGGKVITKVESDVAAIITTADNINMNLRTVCDAKLNDVHCVSEDFLDEIDSSSNVPSLIKKKSISSWGSEPNERIYTKKSSSMKSGASRFVKSMPDKQKVKLKGGAAVDPDSELEDCSHVYKRGDKLYTSVLGLVDVARGTNSYYKLQLLEHDNKNSWWVFRSWGRIGTTIGGNKLEEKEDLNDAMQDFEAIYEEKTGNRFRSKEFAKVPKFWYPLELDYGQEEKESKLKVEESKSTLPSAIKNFISLIFDVDTMKNTLVEFEIDLKKMPLGKLSKKQIEKAYKVLSQALELVNSLDVKKEASDDKEQEDPATQLASVKANLLDCSNKFYTLIPHDFGMEKPPLLNDGEFIKSKIGMLDSLGEIEIAYSLLKSENEETKDLDPIDQHYMKLKTDMKVLEDTSEEFKMIKKYIKNTHASTHSHYTLKLEQAFKIERHGEEKRFKPFKKLSNHKLLWHGSRLTNYAGILSQGLRIAPPEAPVTGYMFGKGVYFADMVSKSANYCCTSKNNNTGFLLLCDVALGDMYERMHADYIDNLPLGKHSTKGVGMTAPDPKESITIDKNLEVPLGKGIKTGIKNASLLYNEYIVYDVAQIYAKYLLQVKFKYNY